MVGFFSEIMWKKLFCDLLCKINTYFWIVNFLMKLCEFLKKDLLSSMLEKFENDLCFLFFIFFELKIF